MLKLFIKSVPPLTPVLHSPEIGSKIRMRSISDFSRKIIETNRTNNSMNEKKIISFEEYIQKHCDSLDDYIKSMRTAFPEKTNEMFKETYEKVCKAEYRAYKKERENPNYNPGLILTSDFFEESDRK